MSGTYGGQKRALDILELELHCVGAGNPTWSPLEEQHMLIITEPSVQVLVEIP